jgi:rhodanese-related sulfurtransferase
MVYDQRYKTPQLPKCEDCHTNISKSNTYHTAHVNSFNCQTCHSQDYNNCGSCHVGGEGARIHAHQKFKIGVNPIPETRPYRLATVRQSLMAPDSWKEYGVPLLAQFDSKPTYKYTTPHNILRWTTRTAGVRREELLRQLPHHQRRLHVPQQGTVPVQLRSRKLGSQRDEECRGGRKAAGELGCQLTQRPADQPAGLPTTTTKKGVTHEKAPAVLRSTDDRPSLPLAAKRRKRPFTPTPTAIHEATELVKYVESNNDYIYAASSFVISASSYRTEVVADPTKVYTIDIRSSQRIIPRKHLKGAANVTLANLYTHIKGLTLANYKYVVVTCYSGQTAAFGVSIVRSLLPLAEANKVVSLKWGMSSIDSSFATSFWLAKTSNARASQFVTTDAPAKPAKTNLPTLTTGQNDRQRDPGSTRRKTSDGRIQHHHHGSIALYQSEQLLCCQLLAECRIQSLPGHIEGAYNYDPTTKPFKIDSVMKTLPTDKTIVLYCYTGQTSAYVGAYLKMVGYDVKSLSYGANSMIFDAMKASSNTSANAFVPANEIKGYKDLLE